MDLEDFPEKREPIEGLSQERRKRRRVDENSFEYKLSQLHEGRTIMSVPSSAIIFVHRSGCVLVSPGYGKL